METSQKHFKIYHLLCSKFQGIQPSDFGVPIPPGTSEYSLSGICTIRGIDT